MIQRIQSIYLLIASLLSAVLTHKLSLWYTIKSNKVVYAFDLLFETSIFQQIIPLLFYGSAIISLASIFLFKNRQLQFSLGRLNLLINLFLLGLLFFLSLTLTGDAEVSDKGLGMFIPFLVILLIILANKAIKKDEELVKSVDRLR
ncbi:MAG: DUF4293 domain-containing protein [Tenacibaculum sp.]